MLEKITLENFLKSIKRFNSIEDFRLTLLHRMHTAKRKKITSGDYGNNFYKGDEFFISTALKEIYEKKQNAYFKIVYTKYESRFSDYYIIKDHKLYFYCASDPKRIKAFDDFISKFIT